MPAAGASDQTFRLIVRPDLWGDRWRIRLANTFGTQAVTFDDVYLGIQASAGNMVGGTNRPVAFGGQPSVTIAAGASSLQRRRRAQASRAGARRTGASSRSVSTSPARAAR